MELNLTIFSDIFEKSSTYIIDYPLEQSENSINHEEIILKLSRYFNSKEDAMIKFIEGYHLTDALKYHRILICAQMKYIITEITVIAKIAIDISQFLSLKRLSY